MCFLNRSHSHHHSLCTTRDLTKTISVPQFTEVFFNGKLKFVRFAIRQKTMNRSTSIVGWIIVCCTIKTQLKSPANETRDNTRSHGMSGPATNFWSATGSSMSVPVFHQSASTVPCCIHLVFPLTRSSKHCLLRSILQTSPKYRRTSYQSSRLQVSLTSGTLELNQTAT